MSAPDDAAAGDSLDLPRLCVFNAAGSSRLEALADRLAARADGNLAEVAALMLDPDEWA